MAIKALPGRCLSLDRTETEILQQLIIMRDYTSVCKCNVGGFVMSNVGNWYFQSFPCSRTSVNISSLKEELCTCFFFLSLIRVMLSGLKISWQGCIEEVLRDTETIPLSIKMMSSSSSDELRGVILPQWTFHLNVWCFYRGVAPSKEVMVDFYIQPSSLMECKWVAASAVLDTSISFVGVLLLFFFFPLFLSSSTYCCFHVLVHVIFNLTLTDWRKTPSLFWLQPTTQD